MKRLLFLLLGGCLLAGCHRKAETEAASHADWTYPSVVYEMNVRQFTPEGTFAEAEKHLSRLRDLGVDVIWCMPIYPIGVKERKGTLGSYYAISDYCAVNPEFGTMADFDRFLDAAHAQGFKVILDWVANHTSPDATWITQKPREWYVRDSTGNTVVQYDWTDIAKLNYAVPEMRRAMTDAMRFWLDKGVDGFRCDMAQEVPVDYWREAFAELRDAYPDRYYLAEGEDPELNRKSFDATYGWELHHLLNDVAQGRKGAADIREYVARDAARFPADAFRLMFTSNHDENSWAGTEFERMGDAAKAMAVLCFTLPNGQPLIYTGQEVGFNRRFEFFEKDSVDSWEPNEYTVFYKSLCDLRHANRALDAGERGGRALWLENAPEGVLAFTRAREGNEVLVAVNLSTVEESLTLPAAWQECADALSGDARPAGASLTLQPWSYAVLTKTE